MSYVNASLYQTKIATQVHSNSVYIFFFSVALYIHDPVYRLNSPGTYLNTVDTWDEGLQKLGPNGGENTAYWPNQVVAVPPEVRFIFVHLH